MNSIDQGVFEWKLFNESVDMFFLMRVIVKLNSLTLISKTSFIPHHKYFIFYIFIYRWNMNFGAQWDSALRRNAKLFDFREN